jgi:hypothetical protein
MNDQPTPPTVDTKPSLYFSAYSGEIEEIAPELEEALSIHYIPLKERPSKSCKKCYGRFHTGQNFHTKVYALCQRCARKYIDFVKFNEHIQKIESSPELNRRLVSHGKSHDKQQDVVAD